MSPDLLSRPLYVLALRLAAGTSRTMISVGNGLQRQRRSWTGRLLRTCYVLEYERHQSYLHRLRLVLLAWTPTTCSRSTALRRSEEPGSTGRCMNASTSLSLSDLASVVSDGTLLPYGALDSDGAIDVRCSCQCIIRTSHTLLQGTMCSPRAGA